MNTLVIGGTGNIGREVLSLLPASGGKVRALLRNPDVDGLPPHVERVRGDLTVPESLDACLDGIDAVFLVWTAPPSAVAPALEKIAKQARRIVFLSSPHKTAHPMFQRPQPNAAAALHADIERRLENSAQQWTFLRPGMLASNARLWWARQIQAGDVVRWPCPSAATAPTDERDIAAVAVRALTEEGHSGAEYLITGPQALTQSEQVSTIGTVIGRSLRMEEISPDEARRELFPIGPPFVINMLLEAWAGAMEAPAFMTNTVAEITGRPARTFRQWATDHAAEFRA